MAPLPPAPITRTAIAARGRWRRVVLGLASALLLASAVFLAGPRNAFGPDVPAQRAAPPPVLTGLDSWLASSEAAYTDIRPGLAKGIVWHTSASPGRISV